MDESLLRWDNFTLHYPWAAWVSNYVSQVCGNVCSIVAGILAQLKLIQKPIPKVLVYPVAWKPPCRLMEHSVWRWPKHVKQLPELKLSFSTPLGSTFLCLVSISRAAIRQKQKWAVHATVNQWMSPAQQIYYSLCCLVTWTGK